MSNKKLSRIRIERKRYRQTQRRVAYLLGYLDEEVIRDFEMGTRAPTLIGGIQFELLYKRPMHELFPHLYEQVTEEFLNRAERLLVELKEIKTSQEVEAQIALVESLLADNEKTNSDV